MMNNLANIRDATIIAEAIGKERFKINKLLLNRNQEDYNKVNSIINNIKKKYNIEKEIDIIFSIDIRNGKILDERLNCVEMIISPIFKKENLEFLTVLYDTILSKKDIVMCDNWSLIKFKPWNKKSLDTICIEYKDKKDSIIITHKDIEYHSFSDESQNLEKINIILFINSKVKDYLLQKHMNNGTEVFIPKDSSILTLLDACIGEYNMLNIVKHIEICVNTLDFPGDKLPLKNLSEKIQMIDTIINTKNKIYNCSRCEYLNTHVKLIKCKCNNVYYCDMICKNAHADIHKDYCN